MLHSIAPLPRGKGRDIAAARDSHSLLSSPLSKHTPNQLQVNDSFMDIILVYAESHLLGCRKIPGEPAQALMIEGSFDPLPCLEPRALRNALMDLIDSESGATLHLFTTKDEARILLESVLDIPHMPCWTLHVQSCQENEKLDLNARLAQAVQSLTPEAPSAENVPPAEGPQVLLRLQEEQRLLEQRLQAMRRVDMERLVTFLPALFERFFATVNPADLALLSGNLALPNIPSPYPEPSPEALRELWADFRRLPREVQQEVLDLARRLPNYSRLKMRPEVKNFLELTP